MANDWIPKWLRNDDVEDKDKDKDKEVPKALKDAIAEAVKASTSPIEKRLEGLDSLTAFAADYKKEKEEKEAADAKRKKDEADALANKNKPTDEQLAALMLTDPASAVKHITQGQQDLLLMMRADQVRDQVLKDRAEDFPYYTGNVKTEIDSILSKQSLAFRNDPKAVENTYYTVVGKMQKEISEGKIKSRFAASTSSQGGSGKSDASSDDFHIEITPDIEKAARMSGIDVKDYVKLVEKAAKAGDIEYV